MPFWTSFCWFMAGSVLFYILNSIMNSGMLIRMINSSVRHSLEILFVTHKSYVLSQELKYDFMRKNNIPEEEIETFKAVDRDIMRLWQSAAISVVLNKVPTKLIRTIKFRNWEEAMRLLEGDKNGKQRTRR